jgi:hypothetical protein
MPLSSIQAETNVIGQVLSSDEAADAAMGLLRPRMFADKKNAAVFQAVEVLRGQGATADVVTVGEAVRGHPLFKDGNAPCYLQDALESCVHSPLEEHAAVIRDLAERRAVLEAATALQAEATDLNSDGAGIASRALALMETIAEASSHAADPLPVMTGAQLFATATEAPEYLVDGVLMAARHVVLYSDPGMGKSMTARHMMVCVATGRPAFGSLPTQRGVAMYVTAEETIDDLKRGFSIVARGAGIELEEALPNLRIVACRDGDFGLATPLNRLRLERAIKNSGARLVVLDTIAALSGIDLKSDTEVMPLLKWASAMSQRLGVTVMWLAHTTKDREASDLDALFGSRQTSAQVDFAFRLLRAKGGNLRLRCAKARGAPNPGELPLRVEVVANESYALTLDSMEPSPSSPPTQVFEEAALQYLNEHPGGSFGAVRAAVAKVLGVRAETVGQAVTDMIKSGRIENRGSRAKFQLHAAPSACPAVSHHVPDTDAPDRVPMSRPPKGGGIGHGDTVSGEGTFTSRAA